MFLNQAYYTQNPQRSQYRERTAGGDQRNSDNYEVKHVPGIAKEEPAMCVQLNRDLDNEYTRDEVVQCQQPGAGRLFKLA